MNPLTLLDAQNELRIQDGETVFAVVGCREFDGRDRNGAARWVTTPRSEWSIRLCSPALMVGRLEEALALLPKE